MKVLVAGYALRLCQLSELSENNKESLCGSEFGIVSD